jgi:hypothetical protein
MHDLGLNEYATTVRGNLKRYTVGLGHYICINTDLVYMHPVKPAYLQSSAKIPALYKRFPLPILRTRYLS